MQDGARVDVAGVALKFRFAGNLVTGKHQFGDAAVADPWETTARVLPAFWARMSCTAAAQRAKTWRMVSLPSTAKFQGSLCQVRKASG